MFTRASIAEFNQARIDAQYAVFGLPFKLDGVDGEAVYSAPRFTKERADGGFQIEADLSARIRKSDWTSYTDRWHFTDKFACLKNDAGQWIQYRIVDVTDGVHSKEWILQLLFLGPYA